MDLKLPAGEAGQTGQAGTSEAPGSLAGEVLQGEVQVSPEVRARILRQIDQVMAEGRRPAAAAELAVKARKKGILYPILINVVAAVVVALGFLSLGYVSRGEQNAVSLASAGFQSAEGRLLEAFRRQSESRLQEEQAQTLEARTRLRATEESLEYRLREREQDLRRTIDFELKAERERLNARGLAVAEVEARLRALEAERQAALAAEVGQIRAGLRLQEMADARDQERLVGDRIRAALSQTLQRLQDDELAAARRSLAGLKSILGEPVMQENRGLRDRLPVDLLVAEALTELIARRGQPEVAVGAAAAEAERARLRAELDRTRAEVAYRDRQISELQRDLRARKAASDVEASRLSGQLAAATSRAESSAQAVRAAEDKTARLGREEAFKQVIAFLDYMKADPARRQQLTSQLAARARQDPLYATVAREIQILAAGAGLGASASPFKLLGTVSSVASGRVVVEPLVVLAVKPGARVQIRRASGLASEVLVARGIVQLAGAGGVTVLLDVSGQTAPEVMDVVYVE